MLAGPESVLRAVGGCSFGAEIRSGRTIRIEFVA